MPTAWTSHVRHEAYDPPKARRAPDSFALFSLCCMPTARTSHVRPEAYDPPKAGRAPEKTGFDGKTGFVTILAPLLNSFWHHFAPNLEIASFRKPC